MKRAVVTLCLMWGLYGAVAVADDNTNDWKKLTGVWKVVSSANGAIELPPDLTNDILWIISKDKISNMIAGKIGQQWRTTIKAERNPKEIDLRMTIEANFPREESLTRKLTKGPDGSDDLVLKGTYEITGDTLTIVWEKPFGARPLKREFQKRGTDVYDVLKRVK